jgi:anti-sigma factor RsiW
MNCPFEEEVSALFDGELAGDEAARVEAHVTTCASCRALLDDLHAIRGTLAPLQPIATRSVWRRRVSVSLPLAAAIAIVLLLAPFLVLRRSSPPAASSIFARYDGGGRAVIRVVKR